MSRVSVEKEQHVLIAEDNSELADLFATWLSPTYHVDTACEFEEATQKVNSSIDVVLLDRQISRYSEAKMLQKIRYDQYRIQSAVITAIEPDFNIAETGFDDYIVKPISCRTLIEFTSALITRGEYTKLTNNLYQLSKKKALLEEQNSQRELRNSNEYEQIVNRLKSIQEHADMTVEEINHKKAFSELS